MEFSFRQNEVDFGFEDDVIGIRMPKYAPEMESWTSCTDDISDSMFAMDFLRNFNENEPHEKFCDFNNLTEIIKMETDDYEINMPPLSEYLLSPGIKTISSSSSDSGLSSDNLEIETTVPCESANTVLQIKTSSDGNDTDKFHPQSERRKNIERNPKVIVQKLPTILTKANVFLPRKIECHKQLQAKQDKTSINHHVGNQVKLLKLSPQLYGASNNKPVTIQVKNSSSGAKIQAKPGTLFLNKAKLTDVKKIVRVQNGNPRSILIPVALKDAKELKTFKIFNAVAHSSPIINNFRTQPNHQPLNKSVKAELHQTVDVERKEAVDTLTDKSFDSEGNIVDDVYNEHFVVDSRPYPRLVLTSEEKRLLSKEEIKLPTHYPLTKHEERELKRIRRKIRNKISAQDSRKRKKEYVDGLEERVKQCSEENQTLLKRIKMLQAQNQNLMSQMKKFQLLLTKGTNKPTNPTTCLMVLLLSLALIAAPNLKLGQHSKEGDIQESVQESILQNRRNLLFDNEGQNADVFDAEINMSDVSGDASVDHAELEGMPSCEKNSDNCIQHITGEQKCKKSFFIEFQNEVDDENWYHLVKSEPNLNPVQYLRSNAKDTDVSAEEYDQISNRFKKEKNGLGFERCVTELVLPTVPDFFEPNKTQFRTETYSRSSQGAVIDISTNQIHKHKKNHTRNISN